MMWNASPCNCFGSATLKWTDPHLRRTDMLSRLSRLFLIAWPLWSYGASVRAAGQDTFAGADRLYSEKSFALALKGYEAALKNGLVPDSRRDEVAYRICVCLGRSQQWDRALLES